MKKLLCAVLALAMMMTACLAMAETVEEVIAQASFNMLANSTEMLTSG